MTEQKSRRRKKKRRKEEKTNVDHDQERREIGDPNLPEMRKKRLEIKRIGDCKRPETKPKTSEGTINNVRYSDIKRRSENGKKNGEKKIKYHRQKNTKINRI